jgi:anti-sigma-K factor RskA
MANANRKITAALISDYAAGRLDVADVQAMEETINRDEDVAAAVAAARRVDARMTITLAASKLGAPRPKLDHSLQAPAHRPDRINRGFEVLTAHMSPIR